jgi:hypothetical protein
MIIGLSACGGSSTSYKEPFAFLESEEDLTPCYTKEDFFAGVITEDSYFKKEETPSQKETLDRMMAGSDKKIAVIDAKYFAKKGYRIEFNIINPSTSANLKKKKLSSGNEYVSFEVSLKEFPEIGYPFDKYWIIVDKKGNIARIQHVPGSYSWTLERQKDHAALQYGVLTSGGEWSRAADRVEIPGSIDGVPKSVLDRRRDYWENLGKE